MVEGGSCPPSKSDHDWIADSSVTIPQPLCYLMSGLAIEILANIYVAYYLLKITLHYYGLNCKNIIFDDL